MTAIWVTLTMNLIAMLLRPFSFPLPFNRYFNKYFDKLNSDIGYLDNKLNSDTIKALQPSSDGLFSFTYN